MTIEWTQGDTVPLTIKVTDPSTGQPVDLTGTTGTLFVHSAADVTQLLASGPMTVTDAAGGTMTVTPIDELAPGDYETDAQLTGPQGTITTDPQLLRVLTHGDT